MIAPTLFLYASFLICFVFWVQNNFSWLWEHWRRQLELPVSSVPAVASCALCPPHPARPLATCQASWSAIYFTFACYGHLRPKEVAVPVASFLSNPRSYSQSYFFRYKKEDASWYVLVCLPVQPWIMPIPLRAPTYSKNVTIILLKRDTFLLFSVVLMVLGILQKYEINFVSFQSDFKRKLILGYFFFFSFWQQKKNRNFFSPSQSHVLSRPVSFWIDVSKTLIIL